MGYERPSGSERCQPMRGILLLVALLGCSSAQERFDAASQYE